MASYLGDFELLKLQQFGSIFTLRARCHRWKRRCTRDAEALRDVAAVMHFIGEIQPVTAWGADGDNHDLTFVVVFWPWILLPLIDFGSRFCAKDD